MKGIKEALGNKGMFWFKYFIYLAIIIEFLVNFNILKYVGYSTATSGLLIELLLVTVIGAIPYLGLKFNCKRKGFC